MRKFMRTRAAPAEPSPPPAALAPDALAALHGQPHKTNGHANGVGAHAHRDDHHSTLSRYWSGSEGSGVLFEDASFPATWRSLGNKRLASVRWRRPHELCARPRFRGDDALPDGWGAAGGAGGGGDSASDACAAHHEPPEELAARWSVEVGEVGDGCLCCAGAALALTPRLLDRAAPPQSFREHYSGAFRFRFWVFGVWREVVVDDRLPTRGARLLCSRSATQHDFTLPLLEKAYAKLYGSYSALRGGSVARALQDLSGGIVQSFSLRVQPRALTFQVLNSAVPRSTLLVATVAQDKEPGWRRLRSGLVTGQAYCVTGLARVRGAEGAPPGDAGALVRLRAPSGRGGWSGAWAPSSPEWRALPPPDQELLALRADRPGDFWMSFSDFARSFSQLELVHVGPDDWLAEPALHARRPWRAVLARRRWRRGYNAGGPPHCRATTATNPQFHVQVPAKCHVVVSVTQQYGAAPPAKLRAIGFAVYELPAGAAARRPAAAAALHALRPLDVTHESRAREVVTFFTLPPGRYLVVPHTRRPHTDAAFLLRILTDEQTDVWEVNEDNVIVRDMAAEFLDDAQTIPAALRAALGRRAARGAGGLDAGGLDAAGPDAAGLDAAELDAAGLRAALRRVWRACLCARPSLELCRALVPLRDRGLRGAMRARDLPALVALLAYWRHAFLRGGERARRCGPPTRSSYGLRELLWAAGVTASNKVLECLVLRFARAAWLTEEAYVMALARLHLAHERYRSLDTKMKSNPLSLEEMILMTIYS